jgi:hypothetical protein
MNKRIIIIAGIVFGLLINIAFGINIYLWDKQTKDIDTLIKAFETRLDEKNMVLSYDHITYKGYKSWHVVGEIVNLKIASKSQPANFASMKKLSFENDSQNNRLRFVGDETIYNITSHYKIYGDEDFKLKVTYSGQLPTLDLYFKPLSEIDIHSDANAVFKTISKIEYNEGPAKGVNLVDNEETYSSDGYKAVGTFDDSTEIKKLGLLINHKNLKIKLDKSTPMSGPQNFNLDINTELTVNDKDIAVKNLKFENLVSAKAIINDLTYSNDIGRLNINGTGMFDIKSFLPEINASIIIGDYEKILDYTNTLLPDLKNAPVGAVKKVPSEINKDQMVKFKQFLSTFKMNETDIKFDVVFDKTGNMTISGKPIEVFMQEYEALMAPPAPPPAEVIPNPTEQPVQPSIDGAPVLDPVPQTTPQPIPQVMEMEPAPVVVQP